ncbi:STAS domain-containing protein [Streptomyces sp. NBC_01351]|uniref:STAS domain-containing protein n=1 Tax=Streptomyces sp. NBC_01351 TaxID=2903833 RepID=UPI002E349202|nr:STAS domain-containing protein [Streptomyces sp. NBC_01351]
MVATAEGDRFTVEVRHVRGATVLRLGGELDHDTAEPLREALEAVSVEGGGRLLVDFTDVDFCDSTGLNVLLRGRLTAEQAGARIELVGLRRPVERMFRITGADEIFPVYADVAEALAGHPQHR